MLSVFNGARNKLLAFLIAVVCNSNCARNYKPVCGSDSVSYNNECLLEAAACNKKARIVKTAEGKCKQGNVPFFSQKAGVGLINTLRILHLFIHYWKLVFVTSLKEFKIVETGWFTANGFYLAIQNVLLHFRLYKS